MRKLILFLFFSQQTPLHWSALYGHLEVARLLLQCNADMGTDVEPLLVGVPGNHHNTCCGGLRVDNLHGVSYDTPGSCRSQYFVRHHCSWPRPECGAGCERTSFAAPGACVLDLCPLYRFNFISLSLSVPYSIFCHGQVLIGLLGAGASKGDGPLSSSVPPSSQFPASWTREDRWMPLGSPLPLFAWAFYVTRHVEHITPGTPYFSRRFYICVKTLMYSFRIRKNRRTRYRRQDNSTFREACLSWLRAVDLRSSISSRNRHIGSRIISTPVSLMGPMRLQPNRPLGYLCPQLSPLSLRRHILMWTKIRSVLLPQGQRALRTASFESPADKSLNVLVWNVGADINKAPHYSILTNALRAHRVDVAFLQEFRNVGILRPLWRLRPVAVWPSITTVVGDNTAPHVFGGSLIASRLGYLSKNSYSLQGSVEFNSVALTDGLHFVNVYLPCTAVALRGGDRNAYDDSHFLDHVLSLISSYGSSVLIAGDFNADLKLMRSSGDNTPRMHTLLRLLDEGFEVMNPIDAQGRYLDTHYSSSSRTGSAIDVVLWRGPLGRRSTVHSVSVRRLHMHHRDHYGLIVHLHGAFPRTKQSTPMTAFSAFAKCLETAPPSDSFGPMSPHDIDCQSALDLWPTTNPLSESSISGAVATWHKAKVRRESCADPLFSRYHAVTGSMVAARESLRSSRAPLVIIRLYRELRTATLVQRKLRRTIADRFRSDHFLVRRPLLAPGDDNVIRNFLLRALRAPGKCLDLNALSLDDFERFRRFYSECWDPPEAPDLDLSFLGDVSPPVLLLPNAVEHDITGPCDEEELFKALSTLRLGKAPGPSKVTTDFYKIAQTHPDVCEFLLSLVNQCLLGHRPSCLDDCRLVLIFKKGDRSDPTNWRPINLTNAAFRVCEAVFQLRLTNWSERILSDNAFGFRPGRGAEQVGYLLACKLHRANRTRRPIHLVTLDIAKAFDTVPHDKLLLALARAGLSIPSVRVLSSMLLGHTSTVGDPSGRHFTIRIRRGVLQGGILSPLLFNIFFDQGLLTEICGLLPFSYADDVSGLHVGAAPLTGFADASAHHNSLRQQRSAARAEQHSDEVAQIPADSPDSNSEDEYDASLALPYPYRRLMVEPGDDSVPSSLEARDINCRLQVNSWLCERDHWLRSNSMGHNASKSEAVVLNCNARVQLALPVAPIPISRTVTILGLEPKVDGFCYRATSRQSGRNAARLFTAAWFKLRHYVTLRDLRSLLMMFVYSHEVFGSCLQRSSARRSAFSPMSQCIRSVVSCHHSVNVPSLFEFLGLATPISRALFLRISFMTRILDITCPPLVQHEFLHHRRSQPWFKSFAQALSRLPQPKCGSNLCDRLELCVEAVGSDDEPLPDFFTHPLPDDLNAVLVTDGSAVLDRDSPVGPSGWGYVLFYKGRTYRACGFLHRSSSGTAEAMSVFYGLRHCQELCAAFVHLRTDNESCRGLLNGTLFPDNIGCMRLYLSLHELTFQLNCYKVFSHSAMSHRDVLNDEADELASRGRSGESLCECSVTTSYHMAFLARPIPRDNPGRDGEPPPTPQVMSKQAFLLSEFRLAACASVRASQMLSQVKFLSGDVRWMNFPGVAPAIVHAKVMRQQHLYHLRYDLQEHFSRHHRLSSFRTPCPFCGSEDNSSVHRVFRCAFELTSTQDAFNLGEYQQSLCRYRTQYTSTFIVDDSGSVIPRNDSSYLLWLSCSNLLIESSDVVRHLTDPEMQHLADASYFFHVQYIKYSLIHSHGNQSRGAPRAHALPQSRCASDADCLLIANRLDQCRSYSEVREWFRWQGYGLSTLPSHLARSGRVGLGMLPLRSILLKLEPLLAACLCALPEARPSLYNSFFGKPEIRLPARIYLLLREGNHLNVPVRPDRFCERPHTAHLDMPDFVYHLPFHFMNSSILVEAWFAAPSIRERRELIVWPPFVDSSSKHSLPISRVWSFEEIPQDLVTRTRSGAGNRVPRLQLHPNLEHIFLLLQNAIRYDNIRVKWRVRYQLQLQALQSAMPASRVSRIEFQRRLIFSLIFGDVRDVISHQPRGTVVPYNVTSTVEDVLCVPACRRNISISTLPGFSLPAKGPFPRMPAQSVFERVRSQITAYRDVIRHHRDTSPPDDGLRLAHDAMAEHAAIWAREWIESTRDVSCPDPAFFPSLELPALHAPEHIDTLFPARRSGLAFSDDEEDAALPASSSNSDDAY